MLSNGLEIKQIPCFLPVSDHILSVIVVLALFHRLVMLYYRSAVAVGLMPITVGHFLYVFGLQGASSSSCSMADTGSMPTRHPCLF